ncbi:plancitoxin-1-like [Amphiura filiformis]|uniref:plancitoxin-1-like n=1 Tax=Amphiura filiformis TaxID=82378 RepID=UPI003B220576
MTGSAKVLLVVWISLMCVIDISYSLDCLDMAGKPVSWFIALKLPQSSTPATTGAEFMYMDAKKQKFTKSSVPLTNINQAIGRTLNQVYTNYGNKSVAYGMYSDQPPPNRGTVSGGHTKGVVALDKVNGFWLVHSVPGFPNVGSKGYSWPKSAESNGQSLLCISASFDQFDVIGAQLLINCANTYDHSLLDDNRPPVSGLVPTNLETIWKRGVDACKESENWVITTEDITATKYGNGQHQFQFVSFAKSGPVPGNVKNPEFYSSQVAPYFKSALYVQTWRSKDCSDADDPHKVYNIDVIKVGKYQFYSRVDHSKWAVTGTQPTRLTSSSPPPPPNKQAVCIGDINRDKAQFERAGGTVCIIENENVWRAFRSAVRAVKLPEQDCPYGTGGKRPHGALLDGAQKSGVDIMLLFISIMAITLLW